MLASLRPAMRATRVPPIAAVREGATLPPGRFARYRAVGSAIARDARLRPARVRPLGRARAPAAILPSMGFGALLVFIGVALFSSQLDRGRSRPCSASRAIGSRGAPGDPRARQRQAEPAAHGSTAAALMIGLALVTLVTMLATAIRASLLRTPSTRSSSPTTRSTRRTTSTRSPSAIDEAAATDARRPGGRRRPACGESRMFGSEALADGRRARRRARSSS